ncbi:MAG TPA: hypothetical protein VGL76_08190 [Gaiellaceae bacterium]
MFAHTKQNMDSIVWTGTQFLYVQNTQNTVWAAPPNGLPVHVFATMPKLIEETRCLLSPGTHGFPAGVIFCHSPDDKIYEIPGKGGNPTVFATLPVPSGTVSDGALAFDSVGRFGYRLVAATGRSGANQAKGGTVYTVDPSGAVHAVGGYSGAGADNVAIAPAGFGSVGGDALLSEDGGSVPANLVAMDASGKTHVVVHLALGLNPIVPIEKATAGSGRPRAGLYVTDDLSGNTYFAPAAAFASYAGDVLVGSELGGRFWIVEPHESSFRALRVRHNAIHAKSIEAGIFIP